eukprot:Skav231647  [mRNA]  locus=scaffold4482:41667:42680:- [translate_table: standard]
MVMFVGAFSAGKSELINSLMREKVCATGIKPTTSDLHELPWGEYLLVDSAGLDAMLRPEHRKKALEAARRSNVAVVVVNARQPLRDSESELLQEIVKANSEVVMVLNFWNHLAEDEKKECLEYVAWMTAKLIPDKRPPIIPLNAKSRDDVGVQQLCQHLESDVKRPANSQKAVSAKAAMSRSGNKLLSLMDDSHRDLEERASSMHMRLEALEQSWEKSNNQVKEVQQSLPGAWVYSCYLASGILLGALACATGGLSCSSLGGVAGAFGGSVLHLPQHFQNERTQRIISKIQDDCHHCNEDIRQLRKGTHELEDSMQEIKKRRSQLRSLLDSNEQIPV